jgi:hypothetical protein
VFCTIRAELRRSLVRQSVWRICFERVQDFALRHKVRPYPAGVAVLVARAAVISIRTYQQPEHVQVTVKSSPVPTTSPANAEKRIQSCASGGGLTFASFATICAFVGNGMTSACFVDSGVNVTRCACANAVLGPQTSVCFHCQRADEARAGPAMAGGSRLRCEGQIPPSLLVVLVVGPKDFISPAIITL